MGAAVNVAARNDMAALSHKGHNGKMKRGLATCRTDRSDAAFQRGDPLFEHGDCGVGEPRIEMSRYLQVEQSCRVVAVIKDIGGGHVDRHGSSTGARIWLLTGVEAERVELQELWFDHCAAFRWRWKQGDSGARG